MSDLISRKALLNHLSSWQMEQFAEVGHEKEYNLLDMIIRGIENEPTVEAVPVVHGEWIDTQPDYHHGCGKNAHVCSSCQDYYTPDYEYMNFCPNCGADMRKKVF